MGQRGVCVILVIPIGIVSLIVVVVAVAAAAAVAFVRSSIFHCTPVAILAPHCRAVYSHASLQTLLGRANSVPVPMPACMCLCIY